MEKKTSSSAPAAQAQQPAPAAAPIDNAQQEATGRQSTGDRDANRGRQPGGDRTDRGYKPRREDPSHQDGYSDEIIGIDRFTHDAVFRTRGGEVFSVETRKAAPTPTSAPTPAPVPIVIVREPAPASVPKKAIEGFISIKSATGRQFVEIRTDDNLTGHSWFAAMTEERVDQAEQLELTRAQAAANAALPRITPAQFDQDRAKARREGQSTAHKWWLSGLGILAAIIIAGFIGWAVHGCGHDDLPPASAQQTIVVPAPAQAPACDPVVVSPVVVTMPAPVVNVTVPEAKVVTKTIVREVPAKVQEALAPAPQAPAATPQGPTNIQDSPVVDEGETDE